MPYYAKSEDWLQQSALLLQARPSTTRITTRYHLKPARRIPKPKKSDPSQPSQPTQPQKPSEGEGKPPRGRLILKTFDPCSGATLKYKTSKAAEVTRLIQMLGTLGKRMAGVAVPDTLEDEVMVDVSTPVVEGEGGQVGSGVQTPVLGQATAGGGKEQAQQGGGGGKGKKKKGKR